MGKSCMAIVFLVAEAGDDAQADASAPWTRLVARRRRGPTKVSKRLLFAP
jgi:hypothetical protein